MAKYTFICEEKYDGSKITLEFEANNIHNILPKIETFVRASGFSYMQGSLDFVPHSDNFEFDFGEQPIPSYGTDDIQVGNIHVVGDIQIDDTEINYLRENELDLYAKCSICGIEKDIMKSNVCYDKRCPKDNW